MSDPTKPAVPDLVSAEQWLKDEKIEVRCEVFARGIFKKTSEVSSTKMTLAEVLEAYVRAALSRVTQDTTKGE